MAERLEKEFYRRGLPWGNHYSCALVFDPQKGTFRVRERRTSKAGDEISECPPDLFDDGHGTLPKHRAFRSAMRLLKTFCNAKWPAPKLRMVHRDQGE